jgi:hypothetical protein
MSHTASEVNSSQFLTDAIREDEEHYEKYFRLKKPKVEKAKKASGSEDDAEFPDMESPEGSDFDFADMDLELDESDGGGGDQNSDQEATDPTPS